MTMVQEHAVQPFVRTKKGRVAADGLRLCGSQEAAITLAEKMVAEGRAVGAVALTRCGDAVLGEYEEPDILSTVGQVPGAEPDVPF